MQAPIVQTKLTAEDVEQVRDLVEAVAGEDGTPPLSDHVMLHLPRGGDADVRHLLVWADPAESAESAGRGGTHPRLLGYAHLDVTDQVAGSSAELAVHPEARQHGIGRALTKELIGQSPDGRLRLWAHGNHPGAARLAGSLGFVRSRSLWQMRRPLGARNGVPALADPILAEGVQVRPFIVGQDEQVWTALNNLAFASHPEQGGWGVEEVQVREAEPWFDAAGFFLAFRDEQLVAFHWTKVHGGSSHTGAHAHEAVGEVYVVGVDPAEQGHGLGPALTLVGLHHLENLGLQEVMLYVDEENQNAVRVYERLGFTRYSTDVSFALSS